MAGIYIHIPFCKKLCSYCDFYHVITQSDTKPFIDALVKEAAVRKEYIGNEIINTIYFGGGTPSVLEAEEIGSIIESITKIYTVSEAC